MSRKQTVLDFIKSNDYVPLKLKEIAVVMQVPKSDIHQLKAILDELVCDGSIIVTAKSKYIPADETQIIKCVFASHERGFGFAMPEDGSEHIFVPAEDTNTAMNGDTVIVQIVADSFGDKKRTGKIIRVVNRANATVVGIYKANRNFGFVVPDDKKICEDIFIPKSCANNAQHNQKVVATITQWPSNGKNAEGEISEILGFPGDIGVDVLSVLRRYGIDDEFPVDVLKMADNISCQITFDDIEHREDFRNQCVITIDGSDSKDLDDAICVQKTDNGYCLSVHIADVARYVTDGSPIDKEAFKRGTSVYFTDRVVPMLPKKLSNGICSLNPNEDRLTLSVVMEIDNEGNLTSHYVTEGIIRSCQRMTYEDVEEIINGNSAMCDKYRHIYDDIMNMYNLSQILRKKRMSAGSIDFDFPETKIVVDDNGKAIDVYKYTPGASNKIIEEFMLMANKTIAEYFYWMEIPFVYRIHEKPSADKLNNFNSFLKPMNLHIHGNEPHPMEYATMLSAIRGTDKELLISKVMLRALMKAKYSPSNEGHFGLAFRHYCHFTSPIRRYPDLAIHRIIKEFINCGIADDRYPKLEKFVAKAAEQSSIAEINAMDAERAVEDMKKAEYMKNHIGETFDAIISSVTNFGFFAELDNGIEGLVHVSDLCDDYYIYSDTDYTLTGQHSGKTYKIGDKINITVTNVNVPLAQIDFYPTEDRYYGR